MNEIGTRIRSYRRGLTIIDNHMPIELIWEDEVIESILDMPLVRANFKDAQTNFAIYATELDIKNNMFQKGK